jgi:hypothetical protein
VLQNCSGSHTNRWNIEKKRVKICVSAGSEVTTTTTSHLTTTVIEMGTLGRAFYAVGFWIRETGQAIDRLGSRLQGNYFFQEQRTFHF